MDFHKNVKSLVVLFVFGFFVGNIYANLIAKEYIMSIGVFSEYFFDHYVMTEINDKKYLAYLFRLRIFPIIILWGLGITRLKKIAIFIFLIWTGFLCGIVVAAAIIKMGILGILFVLLMVFPHMFLYSGTYIILLWNLCRYPRIKFNYLQVVLAIFFVCIGIIMECYVNPLLIKMFLKTV